MEIEEIRRMIASCMETDDLDNFDLLEESIRQGNIKLEDLYSLKAELNSTRDESNDSLCEMNIERVKVLNEYYELCKKLKIIDAYDERLKNSGSSLIIPSLGTLVSATIYKVFSVSNAKDLIISFLVALMGIAVVDLVAFNGRRVALENELEQFGDLDELMMRKYDTNERDRGLYEVISELESKASAAFFCETRIDNVIDDLEDSIENKEAKEYIKA